MATSTSAQIYNQPTGIATSRLIMMANMVSDAVAGQVNCIQLDYFVELTGGVAASRVRISRDEFMDIRQLRGMPTP